MAATTFRVRLVRLLLGLLLSALFLLSGYRLPVAVAGPEPVATGTRIGGDEIRTRFVTDLSEAVGFTVYVLPDPYRVLIDLPGVRFDLPPDSGTKTRGLISAYRYGSVADGRSRIVLHTNGPVLIEKSFIVPPQAGQPARIVVDLVKTSDEAFTKVLKADEATSMAAIADAATTDTPAADEPPPPAEAVVAGEDAPAQAETPDSEQVAAEAPQADEAAETVPKPRPRPGTAAAAPDDGQEQPPVSSRRPGRRLVVIDPGHGGIDPGAIGIKKSREKDVVLAFGLKLREILLQGGDIDVVMTRSDDKFLSLKQRVEIARDHEADLFIAIHADTVRGPEARGATIYTLSEKASDAEAEALAHKENRSDIIGGVDLESENEVVTDILIDLVQRESKNHSLFFAKKAVSEMRSVTTFTGKPMRSAGFMVLKAPDVPSVLVELGYLSSRHDETQLTSPEWRAKVAGAMAKAVRNYFSQQVAARTP
jgi:N-acetylmuramoyl-L-alanine amidase